MKPGSPYLKLHKHYARHPKPYSPKLKYVGFRGLGFVWDLGFVRV